MATIEKPQAGDEWVWCSGEDVEQHDEYRYAIDEITAEDKDGWTVKGRNLTLEGRPVMWEFKASLMNGKWRLASRPNGDLCICAECASEAHNDYLCTSCRAKEESWNLVR